MWGDASLLHAYVPHHRLGVGWARTPFCLKVRSTLELDPGRLGSGGCHHSGVSPLVSCLAPSNLIRAPRVGSPPQGSASCVCEGGGWGGAGSWPEPWLQSESPGIPKSSLVAPQCHIRLPPRKGGISDSSFPSPTPSLLPVLAKIRFPSNLWVLRFMCYFSLANDSLFRVRKKQPFFERGLGRLLGGSAFHATKQVVIPAHGNLSKANLSSQYILE